MTVLVPITLFGWVLVTTAAFSRLSTDRAVVFSVIIGFLMLPMASYHWAGIPLYNKSTAISLGLLLGGRLSGAHERFPLRLSWHDLPMILWCFAAPLASSISNRYGAYDGVSGAISNCLSWGVFFWAGKRYFATADALRTLLLGIVLGGMLYFPLVLFELRMSPQLSRILYGFFPHSWVQHIRAGGYRPIVFMEHGLMVSLWMALTSTAAFWLWRAGQEKTAFGFPLAAVVVCLAGATVLCKSGNGWFSLAAGLGACVYYGRRRSTWLFRLVLILIPIYMILRITGVVSSHQVETLAGHVFGQDRVESLSARLLQEELFNARALEHPLFGWGSYGRGWPFDAQTGQMLVTAVDSLWVITLSRSGMLGLASLFLSMGIGPWCAFSAAARARRQAAGKGGAFPPDAIALAVIVTLFAIDSLVNAMVNPIYILASGALVGFCSRRSSVATAGVMDRPVLVVAASGGRGS